MFVGGTGSPYLQSEYRRARELRRRGIAIKRIAKVLGVSPGTVHRWTTDIALSPDQRRAVEAGWREAIRRRSDAWSRRCREQRLVYQREGRARARQGDPLHRAGCMLYWAEGAKDRNCLAFSNSEQAMVVYFKRFLVEVFDLGVDRFSIALNVYLGNGLSLAQIERRWLDALRLPRSCALKHTANNLPTSSSGKRKNKLPGGVCTLKVRRSTPVVQHIFGAIQEYGGFEEPAWLG